MIRTGGLACLRMTIPIALAGLWACAATAPTTFYVLSGGAESESASPAKENDNSSLIGVGPVEIAGYLDRPQIVFRASENELELAEFDKWAEPLDRNIERVLVHNLSGMLRTEHVIIRPWSPLQMTYQIAVRVHRFDASADGEVFLRARWAILQERGRRMLVMKTSQYSEQMTDQEYQATEATLNRDYKGMAAAMSRALLRFSEDMAVEIRRLMASGGADQEREAAVGDKRKTPHPTPTHSTED